MKRAILPIVAALAIPFTPAHAQQWTNALGNNDFANWANWTDVEGKTPTSWTGDATFNWRVNLFGANRAVLGPGQTASGVNRNVLVGDAEPPAPVGSTGELLVNGGTLNITRNMRIGRDTVTGYGIVTVEGGGLVELGYGLFVGQSANAGSTFNLFDGAVNITTNTSRNDGLQVAHLANGNGTVNISGGQIDVQRGNASFADGGGSTALASKAELNLSGTGALIVQNGYAGFGGNPGSSATVSLSGSSSLGATSVRVGFGADSVVAFSMSSGAINAPTSFITFGQGAGARVAVTISGGEINADRMIYGNNTAASTLTMTAGTINLTNTGGGQTTAGGFVMGTGGPALDVGGDAVINADKLYIAAGGLLTVSGNAAFSIAGSKDGVNPTFDFTAAFQASDWSTVPGRIALNGGSISVSGTADPVTQVNYVELLSAAIAAGVIYTDVEDADLVVEYDAESGLTRLVLSGGQEPAVSPWQDLPSVQGFKLAGIGWINDDLYPYLFHFPAGWLMILPEGASLDGFHGYDFAGGNWFWASDSLGGWHYNYDEAEWRTHDR